MNYNKLIKTISEIVNNELIYKEGLTLVYTLNERLHKRLDEHFFRKANEANGSKDVKFESTDDFEVEMGGIIVKFIKDEKE